MLERLGRGDRLAVYFMLRLWGIAASAEEGPRRNPKASARSKAG